MRSDRQRDDKAVPRPGGGYRGLAATCGSSLGVRRPFRVRMESSRYLGTTLLLLALSAGIVLLAASPVFGQTGYTGVPPVDTYVVPVGTYAGLGMSSAAAASPPARSPQGSTGAVISVGTEGLGAPPETLGDGRRNLLTGWDLVTIAALGLTAVVGFAGSTGRFRSR